jgi:hypothetical protein
VFPEDLRKNAWYLNTTIAPSTINLLWKCSLYPKQLPNFNPTYFYGPCLWTGHELGSVRIQGSIQGSPCSHDTHEMNSAYKRLKDSWHKQVLEIKRKKLKRKSELSFWQWGWWWGRGIWAEGRSK